MAADLELHPVDVAEEQRPDVAQALDLADVGTGVDETLLDLLEGGQRLDGDAVYQRALDAGASSVTDMTEMFWGDRVGRVRDPLGNVWWIQSRVADLDPAEMERRAGQPEFIDAMRYVQDAEIVPPRQ